MNEEPEAPAVVVVAPTPELEAWQTETQRLQAEMSALQTKLTELESRPTVSPEKLTALNSEISELKGKLEATHEILTQMRESQSVPPNQPVAVAVLPAPEQSPAPKVPEALPLSKPSRLVRPFF